MTTVKKRYEEVERNRRITRTDWIAFMRLRHALAGKLPEQGVLDEAAYLDRLNEDLMRDEDGE